jgi:acyl dehydratase
MSMGVLATIALTCVASVSLLAWSSFRLSSILVGTRHAEIAFSPHELRFQEVISAILMMLIKPLFSMSISSMTGSSKKKYSSLTLSSPFFIKKQDMARFHRAVGFPHGSPSELASLMLPLFLSAVTEPAMLLLLMHPRCPIKALGAVNVRNRFELLRPDLCDIHHFTKSHSAGLVASFSNESRSVKRGIEYDLEVTIMVPDQAEPHGIDLVPVFRQVFTMLEFRRMKPNANDKVTDKREVDTQAQSPVTQSLCVSLSGDDPSKWAALCKDYNFIHFSRLAAKCFGLPGKLAHGNHIVAKVMQQLMNGDKLQPLDRSSSWMEVHFKRPVVVPNVLDVDVQQSANGIHNFSICSHGKVCVVAEYGTL